MIEKLSKEFPDIVKSRSIGKTWQDRDIMVLELDARDMMEKKGYKLSAVNQTKMSLAQKAKQEDVNKLSSEELMEHNEDIRTGAEKEQKQKQDKYEGVSDDVKAEAAAGALGLDLV